MIKPCPFCGCEETEIQETEGGDVYVECQDCQAQGPSTRVGCRDDDQEIDLEKEATELWETRA